jgi:hypothetical protein
VLLSAFEGIPFDSSWSEMCGRMLGSLSAAYHYNNTALKFHDQGKIEVMSSKSVIHIQAPPGSVWEEMIRESIIDRPVQMLKILKIRLRCGSSDGEFKCSR